MNMIFSPHFVKFLDERSVFVSSDASGKGHILGHQGHSLRMAGAEVGVFEEVHHSCFTRLLHGKERRSLEAGHLRALGLILGGHVREAGENLAH